MVSLILSSSTQQASGRADDVVACGWLGKLVRRRKERSRRSSCKMLRIPLHYQWQLLLYQPLQQQRLHLISCHRRSVFNRVRDWVWIWIPCCQYRIYIWIGIVRFFKYIYLSIFHIELNLCVLVFFFKQNEKFSWKVLS